ncbi:methylated-DNA--[protein]-cysteine S-methyltransferase [Gimesia algae]|uniref:methylated-DNA--[protein]-cysteine S-methyltransferase n=1 Tax=Gimesia algae TaxID=2527971 RepID=A0A517VKN6_9PLAN|nr:methylated-DNA--[protein]-cysteine S-methyltransferase [Gimesia algae]QDT93547.1 Methylated-DNA--protein-cysteine methyltransferase, constitutive [Gimesia algae]
MGQRTVSVNRAVPETEHLTTSSSEIPSSWSLFQTEIGWCGLQGKGDTVERFLMGLPTRNDLMRAINTETAVKGPSSANIVNESNWYAELQERLQDYFQGAHVEFQDVKLKLSKMTPFQSRVIHALQEIGYGEQISYGELAEKAGSPRAARAVGTVMASNRIPILIPCHRVIASGGKLGGFSAPQGTSLKEHLLMLETRALL